MKIKTINIKDPFVTFIGYFFIISGFLALSFSTYVYLCIKGKIEFYNNMSKNKCICFSSKIKKNNEYTFYTKQKKYIDSDPASLIVPVEFDSFKNHTKQETLKRKGLLIIRNNAKATILLCHGFMTCKDDCGILRLIFSKYNIMTFDFRAHGEESLNQQCTFGNEEMLDVIGAANFIKKQDNLKKLPLIVYGFSMGAVSSILAQAHNPTLFDGAIWDCPFESTHGLINRGIDKMKLSVLGYELDLPGKSFFKKYAYHEYIQNIFKTCLKFLSRMDATSIDTDIKFVSTKDAIAKIEIPFLLIGCQNDDKAPPIAIKELYNAAVKSCYRRCWISPGRRHFDSLFLCTEKYIYKVDTFINDLLENTYKNKQLSKIKEDIQLYNYDIGIC